jgi:hypothetical protein
MSIGFIILRNVNEHIQNVYWIESIKCIRKFYPDNKILVVDDNSNPNIVSEFDMENVTIVKSEYTKRGELLPYIYYLENKLFDKAVIIHDSVFIQKYIDFENHNNKYLWHFEHNWDNDKEEKSIISMIDNYEGLLKFYCQKDLWKGCFGGMSLISYDLLTIIHKKFDLYKLVPHITTRFFRICFERIISVMIMYEKYQNDIDHLDNLQNSIFGCIHSHHNCFSYSFLDYINDKNNNQLRGDVIIKIWTGR